MFRVEADELVGAELELQDRRFGRQLENNANAAFTKDINLATAKLCILRSDGEQRLYGVVCDFGDLGVDSITADLRKALVRHAGTNRTRAAHVIDHEQVWAKAGGEIVLDARLLSAQEMSHGGQVCIEVGGESRLQRRLARWRFESCRPQCKEHLAGPKARGP